MPPAPRRRTTSKRSASTMPGPKALMHCSLAQRREQLDDGRPGVRVELVDRMAGRRHAADELAVARLVQPQVELVRRADAQDLAADDGGGAEATAGVALARPLPAPEP